MHVHCTSLAKHEIVRDKIFPHLCTLYLLYVYTELLTNIETWETIRLNSEITFKKYLGLKLSFIILRLTLLKFSVLSNSLQLLNMILVRCRLYCFFFFLSNPCIETESKKQRRGNCTKYTFYVNLNIFVFKIQNTISNQFTGSTID